MKKFWLLTGILLSCSAPVLVAQNDSLKWSCMFTIGYGFSGSQNTLGYETYIDHRNNTVEKTPIKGSSGQGVMSTFIFSRAWRPHVAVETGLFGTIGRNLYVNLATERDSTYTNRLEELKRVNTAGLLAGFGFYTNHKKVQFSFRPSLLIGALHRGYTQELSAVGSTIYVRSMTRGGISWGFLACAGLHYSTRGQWSIGIDGFYALHRWSPRKGEIYVYQVNGENQLNALSDDQVAYRFTKTSSGDRARFTENLDVIGFAITSTWSLE